MYTAATVVNLSYRGPEYTLDLTLSIRMLVHEGPDDVCICS